MFTGIVEGIGTVVDTRPVSGGRRIRVDIGSLSEQCPPGSSICLDGVCLTASHVAKPFVEFDVVAETLAKTTLGRKCNGDRVNLERSLRIGDRLDGHFVQGHVDGTAEVAWIRPLPNAHVVSLRPSSELRRFLIPKGSVALNGVSLTIADLSDDSFSVALIPTTLERTTLGLLRSGDWVNGESDLLVRTVAHLLGGRFPREVLSFATLREAGFA